MCGRGLELAHSEQASSSVNVLTSLREDVGSKTRGDTSCPRVFAFSAILSLVWADFRLNCGNDRFHPNPPLHHLSESLWYQDLNLRVVLTKKRLTTYVG